MASEIVERGHRLHLLSAPQSRSTPSSQDTAHSEWLGSSWESDAAETRSALAENDIDWLVVDHYALDYRWERALQPACRRIMVMDDLVNRAHHCDLLLDPTMGRGDADYDEWLSPGASALLGPRYALLRPEFAEHREESLKRREPPSLERILITMGGADKDNVTGQVLDALDSLPLPPKLRLTVVMGSLSPWLDSVRARAVKMRNETDIQVGVRNMAQLMTDSDLAIGAAGGTSWERCCLGLPTFVICLADNQVEIAKSLQDAGAVIATKNPVETAAWLSKLISSSDMEAFLSRMNRAAARVTDGRGTDHVYRRMME